MNERSLDLAQHDLVLVQHILQQFVPERPVYVFGSRATGKAKRRSDLDPCIGGEAPLARGVIGDLLDAFDESDLPIEVDVVDLAEATGIFRKRMLGEAIPLPVASLPDGTQVAA